MPSYIHFLRYLQNPRKATVVFSKFWYRMVLLSINSSDIVATATNIVTHSISVTSLELPIVSQIFVKKERADSCLEMDRATVHTIK